MKTYWPARPRKRSRRERTSSAVYARKSATTSNSRPPRASRSWSMSRASATSRSTAAGSSRPALTPRLTTETANPRSTARETRGRADGSGAADEQRAHGQSEPPLRWGVRLRAFSLAVAGDGDFEGAADLAHPLVAETAEPFDQRPERHALDRVEVDDRCPRDRIHGRLEQHLTRKSTDRRRARPDETSVAAAESPRLATARRRAGARCQAARTTTPRLAPEAPS